MNITDLTDKNGLITRSFAIRSTDTAKREFTGIGVPYGEDFNPGYGWKERFEAGAIDPADGAKIYWQHREVIGRAIAQRDTDAGHEVTGKISDTVQGRDAWTLLEDGAVDRLSIGFEPVEWRVEKDDDGTETIIHTKVRTREFSLVSFPAYDGAKVTAIRSAPETKETTVDPVATPDVLTRSDLDPFNDSLAELKRSVAKIGAGAAPAGPAVPHYRSIGEYVKAVADKDETAMTFHRDMAGGAVFADGINNIESAGWLGEYFKMVEDRRRIFNTFGKKALPSKGMRVSYGKITSLDIQVAEQLAEGDALAGPSNVVLGTESAVVHTVGGYTKASFQSIQRSEISVVDTMWKAMLMKYARETEVRVANEYMALIAGNIAKTTAAENPDVDAALAMPAGADSFDWLDLMLDAALIYEERGFALKGLHASVDQFKLLNRLTDGDGRRLMNVYGTGVNQVGELNLSTVDATLGKVPVQLIGGRKTTGKLAFYDDVAIETLESPGAPFQLQDEDIIHLTKDLSLYGYVAVTTPFPEAILPVQVAG